MSTPLKVVVAVGVAVGLSFLPQPEQHYERIAELFISGISVQAIAWISQR